MLKALTQRAAMLTGAVFLAGAFALPATAEGLIDDNGASERIGEAGKLRMLSQRIPATACYAHLGIKADESKAILASSAQEFAGILESLENGNPGVGIPTGETDIKVLRAIGHVHEVWQPLQKNIKNVIDLGGYEWSVAYVSNQSVPLLDQSMWLTSTVIGEYSEPAILLQADALLIDIAARQRMLPQRISKASCLFSAGIETVYAGDELVEQAKIYETSLNALRFGYDAAGIKPSTDAQVNAKLDELISTWQGIKPVIEEIIALKPVSNADRENIYVTMDALTAGIGDVINRYNELSKLGL